MSSEQSKYPLLVHCSLFTWSLVFITMNPLIILQKYYDPRSRGYQILVEHSEQVRDMALKIAAAKPELGIDQKFIAEAAMLHDIGYFLVNLPELDYHGQEVPLRHGILGREILDKEGLPRHALVAERHTGCGTSKEQIITRHLPLPPRNLIPQTVEEELISYCDKFFTKGDLNKINTIDEIVAKLNTHDPSEVDYFFKLQQKFNIDKNNN